MKKILFYFDIDEDELCSGIIRTTGSIKLFGDVCDSERELSSKRVFIEWMRHSQDVRIRVKANSYFGNHENLPKNWKKWIENDLEISFSDFDLSRVNTDTQVSKSFLSFGMTSIDKKIDLFISEEHGELQSSLLSEIIGYASVNKRIRFHLNESDTTEIDIETAYNLKLKR